jgi:uncharacterized delta-60 repeat protein
VITVRLKALILSAAVVVAMLVPATAARASNAGDLDKRFGDKGVVSLDYSDIDLECGPLFMCGPPTEGVLDAMVLSDRGVLILTPHEEGAFAWHLALVRTDASGRPDAEFGSNGLAVLDASGPPTSSVTIPAGMAPAPNGNTLVFWAAGFVNRSINIARVRSDGTLDPTYGEGGVARFESPDVSWVAMAADGAGRAVVVGTSVDGPPGSLNAVTVERFNAAGVVDTTFGTGGSASISLPNLYPNGLQHFGFARDLVVRHDGDVVVLVPGSSSPGAGAVLGFTDTGSPDPAFGPSGIRYLDHAGTLPVTFLFSPGDLALDSRDRLLVGGTQVQSLVTGSALVVLRLNDAGTLDPTFGVLGSAKIELGPAPFLRESLAEIGTDGADRVVVGGEASFVWAPGQRSFAARLLETGARDLGFGIDGVAWGPSASVSNVAVGPDSSIVLGGSTSDPSRTCGLAPCSDLWLLRLRGGRLAAD